MRAFFAARRIRSEMYIPWGGVHLEAKWLGRAERASADGGGAYIENT
jgi:hypothetical protein